MISVALDKKKHDRNYFDCGVASLNNYLQLMANQQSTKDNTRTYVLTNQSDPQKIFGYYALTMTSLDLSLLPKQRQNRHQNSHSAGLIARLAVDKRHKGNGFGEWLLVDSLKKLILASETVGFPLIVVDAKDGAVKFYENMGFVKFRELTTKLYMTIADARKSI